MSEMNMLEAHVEAIWALASCVFPQRELYEDVLHAVKKALVKATYQRPGDADAREVVEAAALDAVAERLVDWDLATIDADWTEDGRESAGHLLSQIANVLFAEASKLRRGHSLTRPPEAAKETP